MTWWQCLSCNGRWEGGEAPGTGPLHRCGGVVAPDGTVRPVPNARDETPDPTAKVLDSMGNVERFPYRPSAEGKGRVAVDGPYPPPPTS